MATRNPLQNPPLPANQNCNRNCEARLLPQLELAAISALAGE
jgi:hypothetical protein